MAISTDQPWIVNYVPGSGGNFLTAILWQWFYAGADPIRTYVSRFGNLHRYRDWMLNWQSRDRGQLQPWLNLRANRTDLPLLNLGHHLIPMDKTPKNLVQFRITVSPDDRDLLRAFSMLKVAIDCHGMYEENYWDMLRRRFPNKDWAKLVSPEQLTDPQITDLIATYKGIIMPSLMSNYYAEFQPPVQAGSQRIDIPMRTLMFDELGTMALLREHLGCDPVSDLVSRSLDQYTELNFRSVMTYCPELI